MAAEDYPYIPWRRYVVLLLVDGTKQYDLGRIRNRQTAIDAAIRS